MSETRILIVEDIIIEAEDIRTNLEHLGYTVVGTAASGEEAIRFIERVFPDLVLMDIRLKGKTDGIEAAENIRERFDLPVIYLTAHGDENTLKRAKITEPFGYILKPFLERELHSNVEIALYKHQMERMHRRSEAFAHAILNSLSAHIAVLDEEGTILAVNDAWKQFALENRDDPSLLEQGVNYFESCCRQIMSHEEADRAVTGIRQVMNHDADIFEMEYLCHSPAQQRWFLMRVLPFKHDEGAVVVAHVDITDRKLAEEQREAFRPA